ncbi:ECF transporter S component [Arthrobacter sp. MYb213]|uniref:ECF transporter S component n=1 Tax=Arthrobacter sp. MYb213 TaxID=1848595 RepID=UPI000CFD4DA6|nr:ECF transporter S component [Arthrobacter sp. MYb213]PRB69217.1 hypothetical protein CQ011_10505 [Arthrobacter sp. MYb213]
MSKSEEQSRSELSAFDLIAEDLQRLRLDAGDVPYAEIVRRISSHRISQGVAPGASRPARSTVYDAFRAGRTRLNVELISEIVRALGGTDEDVENWRNRCLRARADRVTYVPEPENHPNSQGVDVVESPGIKQVEDSTQSEEPSRRRRLGRRILLIVSSIAINLLGFWLVATLGIPLYLDMLGTAIIAMILGPWAAVAVAIATNLVGTSITDSSSLAFILVNVTGALIWGYGFRWVRRGGSLKRYYLLTFFVALSCSVVATIILFFVFHGGTGHASEITRANLDAYGMPLIVTVFASNLLYSLADKMLTAFLAVMVLVRLRHWENGPDTVELEADISRRLKDGELSK